MKLNFSMQVNKIKNNIWKIKAMKGLRFLLFMMPIIIPFFHTKDIGPAGVISLQAIFSISILVFEIPTGYVSDKFGRARSLQIGYLLSALLYALYPVINSFTGFAILEIALAFASTFASGADNALLYDSLLISNQTKKYTRHKAQLETIISFTESLGGIAGGVIATIALSYTFYAQAVAFFLAFLLSLTLVEPPIQKDEHIHSHWSEIKKAIHYTFKENQRVKWLILYSSILGASTFISVWLFQPLLEFNQVPLKYFGVFWAALNLSVGLCAMTVPFFQKRFKSKTLMLLLPIVINFSYLALGLGNTIFFILFYLGISWARGLKQVIFDYYINTEIPSHQRATILSIGSSLFRLFFIILGPILGLFTKLYSLHTAFIATAITFAIISGYAYTKLVKVHVV